MIMVTAFLNAKPGMETQVREAAASVVGPSRSESGLLDIHLDESLDTRGSFVFITRWKTDSDFDHHLTTPYVQAFLEKVPNLLMNPPDVRRWKVITPGLGK